MATGRKILTLALGLLLFCTIAARAEKVPTKLSKRDVKNINAQADLTLKSYIDLLNTVSDPSLTASDLDDAISNGFVSLNKIFYQDDFEVDDDSDPSVTPDEAQPKGIKAYLRQFRNYYKQNKDGSVGYDITSKTSIRIGQAALFLKVYFTQTMNGKDRSGAAFPKKILRVAEMQVVTIGGQFHTLISAVSFASKPDGSAGARTITITDKDEADATGAAQQFSEAYFGKQLQAGIRLAKENNFTEAFYAFSEAKNGSVTSGEAARRIGELTTRMRSQNVEPTQALFEGLTSKGQNLSDRYRYDLARKYYGYAREVKPAGSSVVGTAMLALSERERKEAQLADLIEKGAYSEAITAYSAAQQKAPDNPALAAGLGRAYEPLGKIAEAGEAFSKAIAEDPGYPDTYKWQAMFYQRQKDFSKAYAAYINYTTRAEDADDKTILSAIAYCKGMLLLRSGSTSPALDSFRSATVLDPSNRDAIVAQADVLRLKGDLKGAKAMIGMAIARDNTFADAYYLQGQILEAEADKGGAIAAYEAAIKLRPGSPKWYYDLGKLQMEMLDKSDVAAIQTFTACIGVRTAIRPEMQAQNLAYWKRGKCYYLQGKDEEAETDYKDYLKKPVAPPDAFYVDYGNVLIRRKSYDEALIWLKKSKETPSALLSLGILSFLRSPTNESGYADYFERAFRDGVGQDAVNNAPNVGQVYNDCPAFKSRIRKYKYKSDF